MIFDFFIFQWENSSLHFTSRPSSQLLALRISDWIPYTLPSKKFRIPLVTSHLLLTMADIRVPSSLESAKEKLKQNNFPFDCLPKQVIDPTWYDVRNDCGLLLPELIALKNEVEGTSPKYVYSISLRTRPQVLPPNLLCFTICWFLFQPLRCAPSPTHIPIESFKTCATILCLGVTINTTSSYLNMAVWHFSVHSVRYDLLFAILCHRQSTFKRRIDVVEKVTTFLIILHRRE